MITVKHIRALLPDLTILILHDNKLVLDCDDYDNREVIQIIPVDQDIIDIKII